MGAIYNKLTYKDVLHNSTLWTGTIQSQLQETCPRIDKP